MDVVLVIVIMTNTIRLRTATPEDTDEILALDPEQVIFHSIRRPMRQWLYKKITVAVDERCGTIVGMVIIDDSRHLELRSLFVLPKYRRRGIATMLVQKLWDTNTCDEGHWIIPTPKWPIIDGIRRKIKNIGLYGYEMFTIVQRPNLTSIHYLSPHVACAFYTNPSLMGNMPNRHYDTLWL